MLRKIAKAFFVSRAWIISIVFLAAVWGVIESSEPFQSCIKEGNARAAAENFEKGISSVSGAFDIYRVCLGRFTHENAEAIIAAFTIILAFSTIFLWVATRDLVRGAEKTSERQLRAYIVIDANRHGAHQMAPEFQLVLKNCGQTPAYKGRYWTDIQIHEVPLNFDLVASEKKTIGRFNEMPPTTGFTLGHINGDRIASISAKQVNEFDEGKIAFYVFGEIKFVDAFDKPRCMEFRFRYEIESVAEGDLSVQEISSN